MICTCQKHGISRCSLTGCQTGPGTVTMIPTAHFMDSVVHDELQSKVLLTALKTCPDPNLNKSLLLWKFLCAEFEKIHFFFNYQQPFYFGPAVLSHGRPLQLHQLWWWILPSQASVKTLWSKMKYLLIFIWNSSQGLNWGFQCPTLVLLTITIHNALLTQLKSFTALQMSPWS